MWGNIIFYFENSFFLFFLIFLYVGVDVGRMLLWIWILVDIFLLENECFD